MSAQNHPSQVTARGAVDEVDDRATTRQQWNPLHARFGFTVDVAASRANAKCERFYTRETDGLAQSWANEMVWCNPPFSDLAPWLRKAWGEHQMTRGIVMLLPANRTEQPFWQLMVEPYRDRSESPLTVEFLPNRMRFLRPGQSVVGPHERPAFGVCLLIWTPGPHAPLAYDPDRVTGGLFSLGEGA